MTEPVVVHGVSGRAGTELGGLLGDGLRPFSTHRAAVGGFDRIVVAVSGPYEAIQAAGDGLPSGAAQAEAVAVRLSRKTAAPLQWGEPELVDRVGDVLQLCRARGRSSMSMARADPTLVTELQLGAWFEAGWRLRLLRRMALAWPLGHLRSPAGLTPTTLRVAADLAFWDGVRDSVGPAEHRRLFGSSYVALVYHRLAGESKPGQQSLDVRPDAFERQLALLRRLGFRHLSADDLIAFHEDPVSRLSRRRFVVTFDDGFADTFGPLTRHAGLGVQLFIPTSELGGRAHWLDGEPVMSWDDVRSLATAGVRIGAHARQHRRLTSLGPAELATELEAGRRDLHDRISEPIDIVAYPYGDHDRNVARAASAAGYRAAFTTEKGRNGAGTDAFCLRRISVHANDGALAVLWKVITGESVPGVWLRLRALRLLLKRRGSRSDRGQVA